MKMEMQLAGTRSECEEVFLAGSEFRIGALFHIGKHLLLKHLLLEPIPLLCVLRLYSLRLTRILTREPTHGTHLFVVKRREESFIDSLYLEKHP